MGRVTSLQGYNYGDLEEETVFSFRQRERWETGEGHTYPGDVY